MNLQVIADFRGDILWVSGALPGSVRQEGRVDVGRPGRTGRIPGNRPTRRTRSSAHLAKRANAQLKTRKILTKLRCCPGRASQLARAIHVPQLREA